jgi:hypothetical protein
VNRAITLIGVAIVVIGLVFSLIPIFDGPSQVLTPARPTVAFNATTPFSLTGSWTIGVDWSSNHAVSLLVVVCRSINTSATSLQTICPDAGLTVLNGTSGSPSFSVPIDGTILIGIVSNATAGLRVNVQLKPTLTVLGVILVVGGAGITAVGVMPRRKAPSSASPQATVPPMEPAR